MLLLICEVWQARLRVGWSAIFHSPSMKTRLTRHKSFLCFHTFQSRYKLPELTLRFRSIANSSSPTFHCIAQQQTLSLLLRRRRDGPAERRNVCSFPSISTERSGRSQTSVESIPLRFCLHPPPSFSSFFWRIIYSLRLSRLSHSQLHAIHKLIPR